MKQILLLLLLVPSLVFGQASLRSASDAVVGSGTTCTPTEPTGAAEGDQLIMVAKSGQTDGSFSMSGWTEIHDTQRTNTPNEDIAAYTLTRGSSAPNYTVTYSGTAASMGCLVAAFQDNNGLDVSFVAGSHYNDASNDHNLAAQPITTVTNDALVVVMQIMANTISGAAGAPSNMTERYDGLSSGASDPGFYIADAVDAVAGTFTPGAYTHTDDGVGADPDPSNWTFAIAPASAAATFTSAPALNDCDTDSCTFDFTSDSTGDVYWASYPPAASAPADCDAVTTATGATDNGSTAVTATVGASADIDSALVRQDYYFCINPDTGSDSSVSSVTDQDRDPRTGKEILELTSISATSIFDLDADWDPDVAANDLFEVDSNTAGACAITWDADGDFSYSGCAGYETLDICGQDITDSSDGLFTTPADMDCPTDHTVHINNTAPVSTGDFEEEAILLEEDTAMTSLDICDFGFEDIDGHQLTITVTSGTLPNGTSLGGTGSCDMTGTPDTESETAINITFTATDPAGDTATADSEFYVVLTWPMPDVTGGPVSAAAVSIATAAPWISGVSLSVSFAYSDSVDAGDIISQIPTAATENAYDLETFSVVVSLGPAGAGSFGKRLRFGFGVG